MDQTINIILATIVVPMVMTAFKAAIDSIIAWISSTAKKTLQNYTITIRGSYLLTPRGIRKSGSTETITSIGWYMRKHDIETTDHVINEIDMPLGIICIEGITFDISQKISNETAAAKYDITVVMSSKISSRVVRTLLDKIIVEHTAAIDAKISRCRYFYKQETTTTDDKIEYRRYPIVGNKLLEESSVENLDAIIRVVTQYKIGQLTRLVILLHGEPGCGKTTFIKALSSYLEAAVIELSLSSIKSNDRLLGCFFNDFQLADTGAFGGPAINKRIYILEDIDADSTIAHTRKSNAAQKKKQTVTLGGLLNALDGIIELQSVVIITTNHVERLDPALIRPGRVDLNIAVGRLTTAAVQKIITRAGFDITLPETVDRRFTLAQIHNFVKIAVDVDHLTRLINE